MHMIITLDITCFSIVFVQFPLVNPSLTIGPMEIKKNQYYFCKFIMCEVYHEDVKGPIDD